MKRVKIGVARLMIFSLALGTMSANAAGSAAAKKPVLSTKKVSVQKGKSKKVTVKNAKGYKILWKIKSKKIATTKKSGTYGVKVTGKKVGKTTLTCTLRKGTKRTNKKCTIQVTAKKNASTAKPTTTPSASPAVPTATATATATAIPTATPEEGIPSLKKKYAGLIDNIGTCIRYNESWRESNGQQFQNKEQMNIVNHQYNSITLENEMKPDSVLGGGYGANLISVEEAKKLGYYLDGYKEAKVPALNLDNVFGAMEEAKKNGLRMRAHTLMWHQQTPAWFFHKDYSNQGEVVDKETMDARLEFFVRTMVKLVSQKEKELTGEAGSIVYCWDVVNEYVHRTNAPGSTTWVSVYGDMELKPSYVKKAFEFAYDELKKEGIQDKVTLFYNDYDTYFSVEDEVALVNFINEGEPAQICSGIGMQSHLDINRPTVEQYKYALETFLKTGLEVQITELDITINCDVDDTDGRVPTGQYTNKKESNEDQAAATKEIMKVIVEAQRNRDKSVSPKGITGLTVWGIYDEVSWRWKCKPLFYAKARVKDPVTGKYVSSIQPKPSFYAMIEALN